MLHRGGDRARAAARGDADRGDRRSVSLAQAHAVTLIELGLYFALLSLLTFGGVSSVIPEMQRYIVDVKGWTTAADFMNLFAVAQAAPGPNVLFTSLIGYRVAGIAGSVVALLGLCVPAAALTWVVSTLWERVGDSPWRNIIRRALAPVVVGLTFAGGYIIATPHTPDWRLWLIALATAAGVLRTRVNPLWLLAGGAVLGGLLL
ncbi:MAG: chromate transporter [Candidatus Rokuibacteriota bacterium]|nr:MAG: chromate transporter [Candidatus Rokubacteria bacterium]